MIGILACYVVKIWNTVKMIIFVKLNVSRNIKTDIKLIWR
jgi:hypothetical protein